MVVNFLPDGQEDIIMYLNITSELSRMLLKKKTHMEYKTILIQREVNSLKRAEAGGGNWPDFGEVFTSLP